MYSDYFSEDPIITIQEGKQMIVNYWVDVRELTTGEINNFCNKYGLELRTPKIYNQPLVKLAEVKI